MNKSLSYALTAVAAVSITAAASRSAISSGQGTAIVRLQPSTPGTMQTGNANLSGTIRAGQFVGGGAGLTSVNAAQLGGQPLSAFGLLGSANTWTAINTFSNASNSFTGSGAGLTNVNAAQLGGQALAAFGRLATAQTWTAANVFSSASNSFTGNGAGLTSVNADLIDGLNSTAFAQLAGINSWSGANTFGNASNAFTGNGSGLTNVNASQLGGLASSAFAQLGGTNTWTGANTFSNASNSFTGNGPGLTNLNASNLTSGALASARFGGIYSNPVSFTNINNTFTGSAVGLVDLNANNMTAGTLLNGRLSGTYTNALTFNNASNSFSGNGANLTNVNATTLDGIDSTAFLQSVPNPLILSGNTNAGVVQINGTTNGDFGQALQVGIEGIDSFSSAIYGRMTTTNPTNAAIQADMFGSGVALFATAVGPSSIGVSAYSNDAAGVGIVAANLAGGLSFVSEHKSSLRGNVGIAGSHNPIFPIDFNENLGDKISLWGTSPTSHYGFGVQGGQMQIFSATSSDTISFGYGGSGSFTESLQIRNASNELRFRPSGVDFGSNFSSPYDLLIDHDFDNDSTDSWIRFYTNNFAIEQVRIQDGDEAATLFDGAVSANGIDFAEAFKTADSALEPGDLVVNYAPNWEHITRSTKAYDQAVIGVISTKPAFVAGMSFDAEDRIDEELTRRRDDARRKGNQALEKQLTNQMREMVKQAYRPVAFMGRVPVKVTGAVQVGDHLTSSNLSGIAMAMTRSGHSIGIALESNAGGKETIMAMIQPRYFALENPNENIGLREQLTQMKAQMNQVLCDNADLKARLDRLEQSLKRG